MAYSKHDILVKIINKLCKMVFGFKINLNIFFDKPT